MNNLPALFTIIFCGVFGLGFIILGIVMFLDPNQKNKIRKPPSWLNNKKS